MRRTGARAGVALALAALIGAGAAAGARAARALAPGSAMPQELPPRVTVLYQNFPNPFPTPNAATTCIWFDLAAPSAVQLEIYDLRGQLVRPLLRGVADGVFPAGRHGRGAGGASGCDWRTEWDGRAANGRLVPPGVYLLRLRADNVETIRKMLFRGF